MSLLGWSILLVYLIAIAAIVVAVLAYHRHDDGRRGCPGATGAMGDPGVPGSATNTGATGTTGATGPLGPATNTGATGPAGLTGSTGVAGPAGVSLGFTRFFALMPGDNSATIAVGAAIQFPQNGDTSGAATRLTASTFNIPIVGTYDIRFQASVAEAGQLMLRLNGTEVADTVVGRATGTSQMVGFTTLTTTLPNSVLEVINPSGNSTALTMTTTAGGTHAVSACLEIFRLA